MSAIIRNLSPTVGGGLVGWWKMDEGTGLIARDASGRENHGTLVNSPSWVQGIHNGALGFNGSNQYVFSSYIANFGTGDFSQTFWILANNLTAFSSVTPLSMDIYSGGWTGIHWEYYPSNLNFWIGGVSVSPPITISNGILYHLVCVRKSGIVTVYANGVAGTPVASNKNVSIGQNVWIGGNQQFGRYLNGIIDEVRIYNRALSQAEITTLYQSF